MHHTPTLPRKTTKPKKAIDPYQPFEDAVDVWGRTFAALGIGYAGATMNLDLLDRKGKYSNGFWCVVVLFLCCLCVVWCLVVVPRFVCPTVFFRR